MFPKRIIHSIYVRHNYDDRVKLVSSALPVSGACWHRTTRWVCTCDSDGSIRGSVSIRPPTTTVRSLSWNAAPGNTSGSRRWCFATRNRQRFTKSLPTTVLCVSTTLDTCGTSPSKNFVEHYPFCPVTSLKIMHFEYCQVKCVFFLLTPTVVAWI